MSNKSSLIVERIMIKYEHQNNAPVINNEKQNKNGDKNTSSTKNEANMGGNKNLLPVPNII